MGHELKRWPNKRRYVRVHGPFDGYHLGLPATPVVVYDLNLGGGFVNFAGEQPQGATFEFRIYLPQEGAITVHAVAVYRQESGVAVRFVDVDADTAERLTRAIDALHQPQVAN